jgi:hypothetical protein
MVAGCLRLGSCGALAASDSDSLRKRFAGDDTGLIAKALQSQRDAAAAALVSLRERKRGIVGCGFA